MSTSIRFLVLAVGLAVALASPAEAAKKRKPQGAAAPQTTAAYPAAARQGRQDLFPPGPVVFGRDYIGYDPDPFIRSQILRDLGAYYGGEN
jgi:hypothetical protein